MGESRFDRAAVQPRLTSRVSVPLVLAMQFRTRRDSCTLDTQLKAKGLGSAAQGPDGALALLQVVVVGVELSAVELPGEQAIEEDGELARRGRDGLHLAHSRGRSAIPVLFGADIDAGCVEVDFLHPGFAEQDAGASRNSKDGRGPRPCRLRARPGLAAETMVRWADDDCCGGRVDRSKPPVILLV
jgi:hypothetical protein